MFYSIFHKQPSFTSYFLMAFLFLGFTSLANAQDIVDELSDHDEFSQFAELLEESGLAEELDDGDYTIFAPSNQALEGLPPQMMQDERQLAELLMGHIVEESASSEELAQTGQLQAVNGMPLEVQADQTGEIMVGNAMVTNPDMEIASGVVHEISEVIVPQQQQQQEPPQEPPQDPPHK